MPDQTRPAFAVIGLPGLPSLLTEAGFTVLGGTSTDSPTVMAAIRTATSSGQRYVAIVGGTDPAIRAWVKVQAAKGQPVLVTTSDTLPFGDPIAKTRSIDLPATLDDILAAVGAHPIGGDVGSSLIESDGTRHAEVDDDSPEVDDDSPDPFAGLFGGAGDSGELDHTSPVAESDEPIFGPAPIGPAGDYNGPAPEPVPPAETPIGPVGDYNETAPPSRGPVTTTDVFGPGPGPVATTPAEKTQAPVIIVFAGKGGVGKSAISTALAERAATIGKVGKVVLIDANRGQGDVRQYLRVTGQLPSILDAAISGNLDASMVGPKRLNPARPPGSQELHIGVVLAPTPDQADPTVVTAGVYADVIDYVRSRTDLVVIDTQISEGYDTSGLIDGVMIPLVLQGAWGLVVSDSSRPGWIHMMERLRHLQSRGVPATRLMAALNRVAVDSALDPVKVASAVQSYATWVGSAMTEPAVAVALSTGRIPGTLDAGSTPEFSAVLDAVLHRVTGLDAFAPPPEPLGTRTRRRGLFGRQR